MKKRLMGFVLAAVVAMAALCGCNAQSGSEEKTEAETTAADTTAAEKEADQKSVSDIVVAELHYSVVEDGGWAQAMHEGLLKACKDLGMDPAKQVITMEDIAEEDTALIETTVESCVEKGAKIIFGCSAGYVTVFHELADKYPDVIFVQQGSDVYDNIVEMQIRGYEGEFLAGYLCGLMNEGNNDFGFCASMTGDASVRTAVNAYTLGARYANPNATVKVIEANSWYDLDIEASNAEALINMGIKYMGMEASSPAIPEKCQEKGAFCIGYNIDMEANAPEAILTSFCWNWAPIYKDIIEKTVAGTIKKSDNYYTGGEASTIAPMNAKLVPQDVQDKVNELKDKMEKGEFDVYAGPLKDNQGNELVKDGEKMADDAILAQEFYVEGVDGLEWK